MEKNTEGKKMKRFGLVFMAAVLGSIVTLGTYKLLEKNQDNSFRIEHVAQAPVLGAAYTVNNRGEVVPLEFTDVAKKVTPAVVHIKSTKVQQVHRGPYGGTPDQDLYGNDLFRYFFGPRDHFETPDPQRRGPSPRVGSGSGVLISEDGYIVTNNHVIDQADDIEVTLDDNRVFKAKLIGTDPSTDLALIQIKEKNLPHVPLANSDEVEVGEWVLAVGNPFNLTSTVTAGIVSAKGRNINILNDRSAIESFIQTDAAINPGNSGGALVNLSGGLVGISTAIASPTGAYAGYGFAVPANIVSKVVLDIQKYGMVQRGYLGLMIRSVDGNLAKEKGLELTEGVYVDSISTYSAAGDAGIREGDVILKVDEVPTQTSAQLLEIIGRHYPGDQVTLSIDRNGKKAEYTVTLRNQDGKEEMLERDSRELLTILGLELEEIDPATARKLDIESGLKVTKLKNGKLKQHTEIKPGFIITKLDGKAVSTVDDFVAYLEHVQGGVMLEGIYEDYPGTYYFAFGL
jgi:Do/DeqQ family serine protease